MENEYENEPVVTFRDVFDAVASTVIVIAFFVAAIALVWLQWHVVKVALTVILVDLVICSAFWWVSDKIKRLKK